jgi:hypothetical protein
MVFEPPRVHRRLALWVRHRVRVVFFSMGLPELSRRHIAGRLEQSPMVEPVDLSNVASRTRIPKRAAVMIAFCLRVHTQMQ